LALRSLVTARRGDLLSPGGVISLLFEIHPVMIPDAAIEGPKKRATPLSDVAEFWEETP